MGDTLIKTFLLLWVAGCLAPLVWHMTEEHKVLWSCVLGGALILLLLAGGDIVYYWWILLLVFVLPEVYAVGASIYERIALRRRG